MTAYGGIIITYKSMDRKVLTLSCVESLLNCVPLAAEKDLYNDK